MFQCDPVLYSEEQGHADHAELEGEAGHRDDSPQRDDCSQE